MWIFYHTGSALSTARLRLYYERPATRDAMILRKHRSRAITESESYLQTFPTECALSLALRVMDPTTPSCRARSSPQLGWQSWRESETSNKRRNARLRWSKRGISTRFLFRTNWMIWLSGKCQAIIIAISFCYWNEVNRCTIIRLRLATRHILRTKPCNLINQTKLQSCKREELWRCGNNVEDAGI